MIEKSWNKGWKFWEEKNAFNLIFKVPSDAETVDLPHDAMFARSQKEDSVNEGRTGFLDGGVYNYFHTLSVGPGELSGRVYLLIEGAFDQLRVYINESPAGSCNYAYQRRYYDITEYLEEGRDNRILLVTQTMDLSTRYYSGSGLTRGVSLCYADAVDAAPFSFKVHAEEIDKDGVTACFKLDLINSGRVEDVFLRFRVLTEEGNEIFLSDRYPLRIGRGEKQHFQKKFFIPGARAWDESDPVCYEVSSEISRGGNQRQDVETVCESAVSRETITTGFRIIKTDPVHGLRINGKKVLLRGGAVHHDQGFLGAATYDEYEFRRIRLMKEAGFNAVRSAHNPASSALLKACDHLGVYVLDEAYDVWFKRKNNQDSALFFEREWKDILTNMAENDYNHPCVIAWSTGNEIPELGTEAGAAMSRRMTELLHDLDGTRFVTNGINGIFASGNRLLEPMAEEAGVEEKDLEKGDINEIMSYIHPVMGRVVQHRTIDALMDSLDGTMDVLGYNYLTERYKKDAETRKDRVMLGSETFPSQIAENWSLIEQLPAVLGEFTWTGWQYMGETGGADAYPVLAGESGDLDRMGVRRAVSYYREIVFGLRNGPCLTVCPPEKMDEPRQMSPWQLTNTTRRWHFPGHEGENVRVEVYGRSGRVRLLLNGRPAGEKTLGEDEAYTAFFEISYEPGRLEAVLEDESGETGRDVLETPGKPEKIVIAREDSGENLEVLEVRLVDSLGRIVPEDDRLLTASAEGGLQILAFASNRTPYCRGYAGCEAASEGGKALLIVKKTGERGGKITVRSSDGQIRDNSIVL